MNSSRQHQSSSHRVPSRHFSASYRSDHSRSASSSTSTTIPHARDGTRSSSSSYWETVLQSPTVHPHQSQNPSHRSDASSSRGDRRAPSRSPEFTPMETDKPYQCAQCGTAFKKNSNLAKHMRLVHLGERKFSCPEPGCGRMFGQKSNLNSHVRAVHRGEKPFVCSEVPCGRRFSQKSGLKAHIKTVHYGERPYVCECGSSFGHRGDLNRHIKVLHEKQRPYQCNICPDGRAFGRKSVLMRHMHTHAAQGSALPPNFPTDH